jgi:hypothetical protein
MATAAVQALLCFILAGFLAWNTLTGLRRGIFTVRFGARISRRQNPFWFWSGILVGGSASVLALFTGLRIAGHG